MKFIQRGRERHIRGGNHDKGIRYRRDQRRAGLQHLKEMIDRGNVRMTRRKGKFTITLLKEESGLFIGDDCALGKMRMNHYLRDNSGSTYDFSKWKEAMRYLYGNLVDAFKVPG